MLTVVFITPAYAQHHSGSLSPPIDFGGMTVALSSILSPDDFAPGDANSVNLSVRFFDSETNVNINSVTYRVQIFQGDNLVANEYFYDDDGRLDLEVRPVTECQEKDLWKCTTYYGEKHAIAGAYYARGDSRPIVQGPIFDKSGQYSVEVSIVGATNPKTMTTSDLYFETFLSIPHKQNFLIQTADAQEFPVLIKSFDDKVLNFDFDTTNDKISYDVSFDWDADEHSMSGTKQTVYLEKDFSVFKQGYDVDIYANGIELNNNSFLFDITSPESNVIRLDIPHDEIMSIREKLGSEVLDQDIMTIEILSGKQTELNELHLSFENKYSSTVTWNSNVETNEKTPFIFSFFDENNIPIKDILYAYSISDLSGNEIWSNIGTSETYLGILSPHGISQEYVSIPTDGKYMLKLILTGQDAQNFDAFFVSEHDFEISSYETSESNSPSVPLWIKNNAEWWAKGEIDDNSFIQGIQFLIKQGIVQIPIVDSDSNVSGSHEIPHWIKNNAGWWAEGLISESDFVGGIEFLINEGIISVT